MARDYETRRADLLEAIRVYSQLVAALIVTTARTNDPQELAALCEELADAYSSIWTIVSEPQLRDPTESRVSFDALRYVFREGELDGHVGGAVRRSV